MIGIYKITNKNTKKSYIGQSIHCGKRLDEHCKGGQLIDEVIQIEGIENFTFEILKEVSKQELSIWEDYYIIKYNTFFPNGYNKKWNCSKELRETILKNNIENRQEDTTLKDSINKVIILDDDLEVLKKATAMQRLEYNEKRICSIEDLQRFYYYGNKEAKERIELDLNDIILRPQSEMIQLSSVCQHQIIKIKNIVNRFNTKQLAWTFYRGTTPSDSDKESHQRSLRYYCSSKEEERKAEIIFFKAFYEHCGIYTCNIGGTYYYKTCFTIPAHVEYNTFKDVWLRLLDRNFLNKEWIHFLDEEDNEIILKHDIELEKVKSIQKILVGKSIADYRREKRDFNNFIL